jgi:hypothetical protein
MGRVGGCNPSPWWRGDVSRVDGTDKVKEGVHRHGPPPSASWAVNAILTECTQSSGHIQSTYIIVCVTACFRKLTGDGAGRQKNTTAKKARVSSSIVHLLYEL